MNEEKTNLWLKILGSVLTLLGILSLFKGDFKTNHPYIFAIIILSILFAIIAVIKFYLYNKKQEDYEELFGKEIVYNRIKCYVNDSDYPKITLIGAFEDELISEIYDSSKANKNNTSSSVTLISTNYEDSNPELLNRIFGSEAKMEDEFFSHKFYGFHQYINIFKASNQKDTKKTLILFWKKNNNDLIGIEIRDNGFDIDINNFLNYSFSVNIGNGPKAEIQNTIFTIRKLWEPLKKGFFKPIFPPTDNDKIKIEWRNAILKNFNDYALKLIKGSDYEKMKITWNITEKSLEDYEIFEDWIKKQIEIAAQAATNTKQKFEVTRYLLIDRLQYNTDSNYKIIVNTISSKLENLISINNATGNYYLKYVNSHNLDQSLKNDFAILFGEKEKIIQSSDTESTPGVLKVYFSKSYNAVKKVENIFKELEADESIIFESLNEFENR